MMPQEAPALARALHPLRYVLLPSRSLYLPQATLHVGSDKDLMQRQRPISAPVRVDVRPLDKAPIHNGSCINTAQLAYTYAAAQLRHRCVQLTDPSLRSEVESQAVRSTNTLSGLMA